MGGRGDIPGAAQRPPTWPSPGATVAGPTPIPVERYAEQNSRARGDWLRGLTPEATAEKLEAANAAVDETLPPSDTQEPCLNCDTCVKLAKQLAQNSYEQEQAALAKATYDPDAPLPPGYERATRADLERLGLVDGDTSLLELEGHPDFHAETFARTDPETEERSYVIGFRGTEAWGSEWKQNAGQSLGRETVYYGQAVAIGERARLSGEPITFVGHSLGGGLAATASGASGLPAQTFNAAGLHQNTLNRIQFESPDLIAATHVHSEILSRGQDSTALPDAYGTRRGVPPGPGALPQIVTPRPNIFTSGYNTYRAGLLHLNDAIRDALGEEKRRIESEMRSMGC